MAAQQRRTAFDPGLTYEVAREFRLNGELLCPGDAFDAGKADPRRMRQLYDTRLIRAAPGSDGRRLVARRPLVVGGAHYAPGDAIPRDAVKSAARLSQLIARGDVGLQAEAARTRPRPRPSPRRARLEE